MPGWTLADSHPTQGRTFQRPLGACELGFYWDGLFNGVADNLQYFRLRLLNGARDAHVFSEDNIARAWVSTKRRYPLSGAIVQGAVADSQTGHGEDGGNTEFRFVVRENDLAVVRPREVVFGQVTCAVDAQKRVNAILDGPRPLSEELLMQLYVFRETGAEGVLHLMILTAHCVTDGMANITFSRCLLDTLTRGKGSEPAQIPLEERLAMAIASEEREPIRLRSLSPAVRRWRRAIGAVIYRLRMAKLQGGHTLPWRLTCATPCTPAQSRFVSTSLAATQTTAVLANCRQHNLTFGAAYPALAQVAMTRVLYRRYLRGDISEEEWTYRKRQPHVIVSPFNHRLHLDKTWFENGGAGEFMLSVGIVYHWLPFMTLGDTEGEKHGHVLSGCAPPFSDLLTFDRFLHRARLVKKQANAFFGHPLFYEIMHGYGVEYIAHTQTTALRWMERTRTANGDDTHGNKANKDEVLAVTEMPVVRAHGGSSIGNVDLVSPMEYPLPPTHPLSPDSPKPHAYKTGYAVLPSSHAREVDATPKVTVEEWSVHLQARPGELYLGATSSRGQLLFFIQYDGNVFEEEVVREWLDEVKEAVVWYLGQAPDQQGRGGCGPRL